MHGALNGLGILCLGLCYRRFTILLQHTEWCVQQTLPFRPYFLRTKLFVGTGGGVLFIMMGFCFALVVNVHPPCLAALLVTHMQKHERSRNSNSEVTPIYDVLCLWSLSQLLLVVACVSCASNLLIGNQFLWFQSL